MLTQEERLALLFKEDKDEKIAVYGQSYIDIRDDCIAKGISTLEVPRIWMERVPKEQRNYVASDDIVREYLELRERDKMLAYYENINYTTMKLESREQTDKDVRNSMRSEVGRIYYLHDTDEEMKRCIQQMKDKYPEKEKTAKVMQEKIEFNQEMLKKFDNMDTNTLYHLQKFPQYTILIAIVALALLVVNGGWIWSIIIAIGYFIGLYWSQQAQKYSAYRQYAHITGNDYMRYSEEEIKDLKGE